MNFDKNYSTFIVGFVKPREEKMIFLQVPEVNDFTLYK